MKWIVREEVVRSVEVEADDEAGAIDAADRTPKDQWHQVTKSVEVDDGSGS